MPVETIDNGRNNHVDLHPWFRKFGKLRIEFVGSNNSVSLPHKPGSCRSAILTLGEACSIEVGKHCFLGNPTMFLKENARISIGEDTTLTARTRLIMHEPGSIVIGRDCMIASDVQFMNGDVHTIYDLASGERINAASDIVIGDHVWMGLQTFVMKGARIGNGSVIGLRSVVTGEIGENCLAVGAPARTVRQGIAWDRKLWPAGQARAWSMLEMGATR